MIGLPDTSDSHYGQQFYVQYVLIILFVFNIIFIEQGGLIMRIAIHNTTPASKTPKYIVWMFIVLFILFCSMFATASFCIIYYANEILVGIFIALMPFAFLLWFHRNQRNIANSYVEVFDDYVIVTEYPWGKKSVKKIQITEIDHTKLLLPSSIKLRGPRIYIIGIPYIVFYNKHEKQLFKLLAYPQAKQFQETIKNFKTH